MTHAQHDNVLARGSNRARQRKDHVLVGGWQRDVLQVLGHGPAGHRHAVAVDETGLEQHLHDYREASDAVELHDVVLW